MALFETSYRYRESTTAGFPVWEIRLDYLTGKGYAYVVINSNGKQNTTPIYGRKTALQVDAGSLATFKAMVDGLYGDNHGYSGVNFNTAQTLASQLADSV